MKVMVLTAALGMLALGAGCSTQTECDYINKAPVNDLKQDLPGCWQGYGYDSLVVYQFNPDAVDVGEGDSKGFQGTFLYVEPPNRFASAGRLLGGSWTTRNAEPTSLVIGGDPTHAEVTETSLRITYTGLGGTIRQNFRRGVCRGFGFEEGDTCPR